MPAQAWESEESGVMASSRHAPCASALLALLGAVFLCSLQAIATSIEFMHFNDNHARHRRRRRRRRRCCCRCRHCIDAA